MADIPFCINCKYYKQNEVFGRKERQSKYSFCTHPDNKTADEFNPVTGESLYTDSYCCIERTYGHCGKRGVLFEPRDGYMEPTLVQQLTVEQTSAIRKFINKITPGVVLGIIIGLVAMGMFRII
jgi:hypothetical protein